MWRGGGKESAASIDCAPAVQTVKSLEPLAKGEVKLPGQPVTNMIWQQYHVRESEEDHIAQQVYWAEPDIAAHKPILNGRMHALTHGASVKPGIEA